MCVFVSVASDSSETVEVIITIKLGMINCLRHGNASHVNYIDLDLHSSSHRS